MPSNLENLQKKLDSPVSPSLPPVEVTPAPVEFSLSEIPQAISSEPSSSSWKKFSLGLGIFLLLAMGVAAFVFYRGFYAFRKDKVILTLSGPDIITSGETVAWKVKILNHNETTLKEGELIFQYPEYAQPTGEDKTLRQKLSLPEISAGESFEKEFNAVLMGGEGFEKKAQAIINFKPSSGNIVFETTTVKISRVSSFPVLIEINLPRETISGEKITVNFNLSSQGEVAFNNLRVRLEYPAGFKILETSEKLSDFNNTWRMGQLLPQEIKTLTIKGQVNGMPGESKVFRAFIDGMEGDSWKAYKEIGGQLKLVESPLTLELKTEPAGLSVVSVGEFVTYRIYWRNNLDIPLSNLNLKVKLEGDLFDMATLISDGSFDSISKTIIWTGNEKTALDNLQPAETGKLNFQIKIKDALSTDIPANNLVNVNAVVESPTKPEGLSVSDISASQNLKLDIVGR